MKHINIKKGLSLSLMLLLFFSTITLTTSAFGVDDIDPLVDVKVTFQVDRIRVFERIDLVGEPDLYVKVFINDDEFESPVWMNQKTVEDPGWYVTSNVPDDEECVKIVVQLWDWNFIFPDKTCDLSESSSSHEVTLFYNIKNGHWTGDDRRGDASGYGRLNGCDDGSHYKKDRDCEMWFTISQNDYDNDGIPYWEEEHIISTDPYVYDSDIDHDDDGIPTIWEYKWGYNPKKWDDHESLDPDVDGIENNEEYFLSEWVRSDPYRKDLFVELDYMGEGPNGETTIFPEGSKELLRDAYHKHNWMYHLDEGQIGPEDEPGGGEIIPFDNETDDRETNQIIDDYYFHNDPDNWRRGVFHYGVFLYRYHAVGGCALRTYAYQISSSWLSEKIIPKTDRKRDIVFASAYMHECGHTLGVFHFNTPGCDDQKGKYPWQKDFWIWRPYRSVMNYGYMYKIVDYSDGSRGQNDFNDWERMDFTHFQRTDFW